MLNWISDRKKITNLIESNFSFFKIILKTKDQPDLLRDWIEHHILISGDNGLIVIDNGSILPQVYDIYDEYKERIVLIKYDGYHNDIHDVGLFLDLYTALRQSCEFYSFIDTDEYVYFYHDNKIYFGEKLVSVLKQYKCDVFLGAWMLNVPGNKDIYYFNDIPSRLASGVFGGKPIISARIDVSGFINHNSQLIDVIGYKKIHLPNFLIMHRNRFISLDRERTNINKMLMHGFIKNPSEVEALIKDGVSSSADYNFRVYIEEIRECRGNFWAPLNFVPRGCFKVANNPGNFLISDQITLNEIDDFMKNNVLDYIFEYKLNQ